MTRDKLPRISRRAVLRGALAASASGMALHAWADDAYPSRPINLVVPYPPGGFGDALSRALAQKISDSMKVPVVIDNRPGAGGQIGVTFARQQPANGYTMLFGDIGPFAITPHLYEKLPYDMQTDFAALTRLTNSPSLLVVGKDSPLRSVDDLLKASKRIGGGVSYGSYGVGSAPHIFTEMLKRESGGRFEHAAYKGAAPALQDLMGGHIDVMCDVIFSSAPLVREGKLRALAVVGSDKRLSFLPQVPTIRELGLGSIDLVVWTGMVVRAGTPEAVVRRLNAELVKALNEPDIVARYTELGLQIAPQTPEQFQQFMRAESQRWDKVVKAADIRLT